MDAAIPDRCPWTVCNLAWKRSEGSGGRNTVKRGWKLREVFRPSPGFGFGMTSMVFGRRPKAARTSEGGMTAHEIRRSAGGKRVKVKEDHNTATLRGREGTIIQRWGTPGYSAPATPPWLSCSMRDTGNRSRTTSWGRSTKADSVAGRRDWGIAAPAYIIACGFPPGRERRRSGARLAPSAGKHDALDQP
jgi:hypothetical protein